MPAGVVTLLEVRNACKQSSDNVGQAFLSDAEWDGHIQRAYQELYGMVVQAFGNDYFVQTPATGYQFTTDGINSTFALPDGSGSSPAFFKLLGVDLRISAPGQWATLHPFPFAERNRLSITNSSIPMAGQVLRLLYVPRLTVPTLDADTIDGVNGWEDWMIAKACFVALAKEESDLSSFAMRMSKLEERLKSEPENRDSGFTAGIADTRGRGAMGMRYRLNGNNIWLIGGSTPAWPQDEWTGYGDYGGW